MCIRDRTFLESNPSTRFSYSNWGYVTAGGWLEMLSSKPWETLMEERIFNPLGLQSAGFGAATGDAPWPHRDNGQPVNPTESGADNAPVLGPAGTVHMSIRDLATYGAMHLAGSRGEPSLLPQGRFLELHVPTTGTAANADYAYGWFVGDQPQFLWHNGSNTMNFAYLLILPAADAVIAIATNQGGGNADDALNAIQVEFLQYFSLAD